MLVGVGVDERGWPGVLVPVIAHFVVMGIPLFLAIVCATSRQQTLPSSAVPLPQYIGHPIANDTQYGGTYGPPLAFRLNQPRDALSRCGIKACIPDITDQLLIYVRPQALQQSAVWAQLSALHASIRLVSACSGKMEESVNAAKRARHDERSSPSQQQQQQQQEQQQQQGTVAGAVVCRHLKSHSETPQRVSSDASWTIRQCQFSCAACFLAPVCPLSTVFTTMPSATVAYASSASPCDQLANKVS